MTLTVSDMLTEAHRVVEFVEFEEAIDMMRDQNALLLDVRDAPEVEQTGLAKGAHHVSRGMLEFRADAETPFHDKEFDKQRPVVIYCVSGGRSALAGKVLIDMGYEKVFNLGGFKDWQEAGGPILHPLDPGMS